MMQSIHTKNIRRVSCSRFASIIIAAFFIFQGVAVAQDGEALFKQTCAACHMIGGRLVGPDLKGISEKRSEEWLIKWTKSSQALIKSGDSDAIAIYEEFNKIMMPDNNFPDADIKAIYSYITTKSGGAPVAVSATTDTTVAEVVMVSTNDATKEEILLGQKLFEGAMLFHNRGASCISCHNVASSRVILGGNLAKDLTTSHSRMGGDAGLTGILNAPPFPAMTEAYKNNPLTEQEIFALTAFLNTVEKESAGDTQMASALNPLLTYGFAGFILWMCVVWVVWLRRKKEHVKLKIYERQVKSK